ncbi:MAG: 4Fe-4S binding protein [Clostridiales bacterium]|nr:4Fe-4S binding protein [Clostridiales bacterium]
MLPYLTKALTNLVKKPVTEKFPAGDPPKAAEGYRGRIQYDPEKCVNCGMCMRVCAPQCMHRDIEKLENGDQKITFTFDLTSCTFCSMCADFCARHAITLSDDYMIVGTQPEDFLVTGAFVKKAPPPKPKFTPEQIAAMKAKAEAAKAAKAAAGGAAPKPKLTPEEIAERKAKAEAAKAAKAAAAQQGEA